jgi:hypothetical protein
MMLYFYQKKCLSVQSIHVFTTIIMSLSLIFLFGGCDSDSPTSSGETTVRIKAGLYTQWLYDGKFDLLWDNCSDTFKLTYGSSDYFAMMQQFIMSEYGKETQVRNERVISIDTSRLYQRSASFEKIGDPVAIEWLLDSSFNILFFNVRVLGTEASSDFLDYQTKTDLRLPFDNEWVVIWGGRSIQDNYHVINPNQRFASDFVIFQGGMFYTGDGSRNEDYYCFGQPILAPGAGVVITSENTVPDNTPPEENHDQPLGNYVVIDHENGEYSMLFHFQQGSVTVRTGDVVQSGQLLGSCGNTGESDMPHLHYHLQNSPDPFDLLGAQGLPVQFQSYLANGRYVQRGEPTRGQSVQNR